MAERVRRIRGARRTPASVAREAWRRRGPLLPALIFMIVVTQIPFLFTLYYSTAVVEPGSAGVAATSSDCSNYVDVSPRTASSGTVALNTVIMIVGVVLISVVLGLLLALLLDREFLGRGDRAHPADHAVPGHAGCGRADVEDDRCSIPRSAS